MFTTPMFGVHHIPEGRDWLHMKETAHLVEDNGYDLFTITDHFMNMANPNGPNNHPLEAWTLLAALAAETKKIRLATLVTCYAYRRPTVLAKMATTVDIISNGRLIFGIGAGMHQAEFKGFMGKFPNKPSRVTGLKETVEIVHGMFNNTRFSYSGKLYKVDNVLNLPQSIQKPIPILIGGSGEVRSLRYTAKYADFSHFFARDDIERLKHKLSVLKRHCERVGRDYDEIIKATTFRVALGSESEVEKKALKMAKEYNIPVEPIKNRLIAGAGKPDKVADNLKEFFDNGLGMVNLVFIDRDDIPVFAEEVISQIR